jgi:tetratricopeptide (TPR) repeat protein
LKEPHLASISSLLIHVLFVFIYRLDMVKIGFSIRFLAKPFRRLSATTLLLRQSALHFFETSRLPNNARGTVIDEKHMRNSTIKQLAILLVAVSPFLGAEPIDAAQAAEASSGQAKPAANAQVSALIKKGIAKAKEQDFHQSINAFNEAIALDPASYDAYVNRGWTFRQMGDFDKAIADYTSAITAQPNKAQVYLNRGWCHKRLGKMESALADFDKAIEIDPKYINAYRNRGSLKLKIGDYAGSIADFNQVMVLDPNAKTEVAKYLPPELMEGPKNLDPKSTAKIGNQIANAIQGSSIEISDTDLAKLNNRAARAIKTGEFATAISILEDIAKKKPNYTFAKENLTTAYNNQGLKLARTNAEESASQFRKALFYSSPQQSATRANLNVVLKSAGKDPESDAVRIALGDELRSKGDLKGAFVEYMEAMRLNKSPEVKDKITEVLGLLEAEKRKDPTIAIAETKNIGTVDEKTGRINLDPTEPNGDIVAGINTKPATDGVSPNPGPPIDVTPSVPVSETASVPAAKEPDVDSWGKLPGASATPLALTPVAKEKVGEDKDTYKLKWHNHVSRGDALYDQGNYMESEAEYKSSLIAAKKLDAGGGEIVDSLERLARIFLVQRRPVEALSLLEQAYNLRKDTQVTPDAIGLERLGKKVLALRKLLYPHQKPGTEEGEEEEEEELDRKVAKNEPEEEEEVETASADTPAAAAAPKKKISPLAKFKRKKTPHEAELDAFETSGENPSAYTNRPSWDKFNR